MATDDESREKYLGLSDKVNEMVESVKHAIVLLQIAKVLIYLSVVYLFFKSACFSTLFQNDIK